MLVTASSVGMAMLLFFVCGVPHFEDLNFEVQGLSRQGVLVGQQCIFPVESDDPDRHLLSPIVGGGECHTDLNLDVIREVAQWHPDGWTSVVDTIGILGSHARLQLLPGTPPLELLLQPRNDVSAPVKIGHGCAIGRAVDLLPIIVGEAIVEERYAAV